MSFTDNSSYGDIIASNTGMNIVGGMLVFFVIFFIIMIAVSIFMIVCQYKIFSKNDKPGWYAIIPFLNTWTLFEIAGNKGWLSLIPFVNIVFLYISNYKLAIKMGKSSGMAILVTLIPVIGYPILAFSKDNNVSESNVVENNQPSVFSGQPNAMGQPTNQATMQNEVEVQNQTPTFIQPEPAFQTPVQPKPVVEPPIVQTPTQSVPNVEAPVQSEPVVQNINTIDSNANMQTPVFNQPSHLDTNMVPPVNNIEVTSSESTVPMFNETVNNNQTQVTNNQTQTFIDTPNNINGSNNNIQ